MATLSAANVAAPEDPLINNPSSLIKRLAHKKEFLSSVLMYSSINVLSKTSGIKSYPIPSTLYVETSVPPPRMDPIGSTPTIVISL